ncbi:hypothetical protein H9P43_001378 [Blastocladiella emersonii ATCC 22665]|nr:hypothetical protein H9P43_001378 [Blastocladiella emersonii ATCC 22665]
MSISTLDDPGFGNPWADESAPAVPAAPTAVAPAAAATSTGDVSAAPAQFNAFADPAPFTSASASVSNGASPLGSNTNLADKHGSQLDIFQSLPSLAAATATALPTTPQTVTVDPAFVALPIASPASASPSGPSAFGQFDGLDAFASAPAPPTTTAAPSTTTADAGFSAFGSDDDPFGLGTAAAPAPAAPPAAATAPADDPFAGFSAAFDSSLPAPAPVVPTKDADVDLFAPPAPPAPSEPAAAPEPTTTATDAFGAFGSDAGDAWTTAAPAAAAPVDAAAVPAAATADNEFAFVDAPLAPPAADAPVATNDDFGVFDAAPAPAPAAPPAPAADDDFGFFDAAPAPAPVSRDVTTATDDDDGFGDFGGFSTGTTAAAGQGGTGDDDFGDFGDFSTGAATTAADDDFGAFGTPAAPAAAAPPAPVPAPVPAIPALPAVLGHLSLGTLPTTGVFDLQSFLAEGPGATPVTSSMVPVPTLHVGSTYTSPGEGHEYARVSLNPQFARHAYFADFQRLAGEPLFDENINQRIRWRRSLAKKLFLAALDVPVDYDDARDDARARTERKIKAAGASPPAVATTNIGGGSSSNQALAGTPAADPGQIPLPVSVLSPASPLPNLETLAALAALSEDELRGKPDRELAELQQILAHAVQGLHAQINYFLDAREQLQLDAEMHNKMISVLVQQAQKSHQRLKKGSPPKRK